MALKDALNFDEREYREKIGKFGKAGTHSELSIREINKRRRIFSSRVKMICTAALLGPTGGATAIGLCIAIRQASIAKQKYAIIIEAMRQHGIEMPSPRRRDIWIPLAVNLVVYSLTLGLMWGLDDIGVWMADTAADCGVATSADIVGNTPLEELGHLVSDPVDFVHGMADGATTQVGDVHAALDPSTTLVERVAESSQPMGEQSLDYLSGATAGYQVAPMVERLAVLTVAADIMERAAKTETDFTVRRKALARESVHYLPQKTDDVKQGVIITEKPVGADMAYAPVAGGNQTTGVVYHSTGEMLFSEKPLVAQASC